MSDGITLLSQPQIGDAGIVIEDLNDYYLGQTAIRVLSPGGS